MFVCFSVALGFLTGVVVSVRASDCPPDSVRVGAACVDKYEGSVWQVDVANKGLIKKLEKGRATLADLTAAGALQLGCQFPPFNHRDFPPSFPNDGQWTPAPGASPPSPGVYAASIPGVVPTACITWHQAAQACALAGKRLIRHSEWQVAAVGTPDAGDFDDNVTQCETGIDNFSIDPVATGSRSACVSRWGAFDMVGNLGEWSGDLIDVATSCTTLGPAGDLSCVGGDGSTPSELFAAAPQLGGNYGLGSGAGPFAIEGRWTLFAELNFVGFRCAR
jgi:hypothetical protein